MSRKKNLGNKEINPDPIYNSELVNMIINRLMKKGKKSIAQKIFYQAMNNIKEINKQEPLETLKKAIENITPIIEVKMRRLGGATYQIPVEIKPERGKSIALKLLIKSTRNRTGKNMVTKLQNEIIDAYNNIGNSIKKKEEIHKMAEANKVFTMTKL
jgi:small subunit ribosomal protein S7